jgi:phosphate transport system substrate-binding protein
VQAAAKGADWKGAKSFYVVLTDQPGAGAWPITGATFVLVPRRQKSAEVGREVLKFFDWGYREGGAAAKELGYVPMPSSVVDVIHKCWEHDLSDDQGAKIWPAARHALQ